MTHIYTINSFAAKLTGRFLKETPISSKISGEICGGWVYVKKIGCNGAFYFNIHNNPEDLIEIVEILISQYNCCIIDNDFTNLEAFAIKEIEKIISELNTSCDSSDAKFGDAVSKKGDLK